MRAVEAAPDERRVFPGSEPRAGDGEEARVIFRRRRCFFFLCAAAGTAAAAAAAALARRLSSFTANEHAAPFRNAGQAPLPPRRLDRPPRKESERRGELLWLPGQKVKREDLPLLLLLYSHIAPNLQNDHCVWRQFGRARVEEG